MTILALDEVHVAPTFWNLW